MDIAAVVREIERRHPLPPPDERRASHGQWVQPARVVAELVSKGYGVSDAVRSVVHTMGLHPPQRAERSVRACYYALRKNSEPATT